MGSMACSRDLVGGIMFRFTMLRVNRNSPTKNTSHERDHTDSGPPTSSNHFFLSSFNRKAHSTSRMGLYSSRS